MRRALLALLPLLLLAGLAGSPASAQYPGLEPRIEDLSSTDPNGPAVWQAQHRSTAAQVTAMLPGLDVLWRWDGRAWQAYSTRGGRLLPGAADFTIEQGDRLWIGAWDEPDPSAAPLVGAVITDGPRAGVIADRNVLGDPAAPVLIVEYSDFL